MKRERIGHKIKKIRKDRALTQKQFADSLGYSDKSMITHIEKGDSDMTYEKILLLLREYMLDANELFDVCQIDSLIKKQELDKKNQLLKKLLFNPVVNYLKYAKQIDYKTLLSNDTLYLKPLLDENDAIYCLFECELDNNQKGLVNPASFSIARAYLNHNTDFPFIICLKDDTKVGFITLSKWRATGDAFTISFYIDKRYQGHGYGRSTLELAIQILKMVDVNKPIKLAVETNNKKAQQLYLSLGFKQLDEFDGDDLVFAL